MPNCIIKQQYSGLQATKTFANFCVLALRETAPSCLLAPDSCLLTSFDEENHGELQCS
jgi:hypothetical protein